MEATADRWMLTARRTEKLMREKSEFRPFADESAGVGGGGGKNERTRGRTEKKTQTSRFSHH